MDIVNRLRDCAKAYPEDMFIPLTPEETKTNSRIVTQASAGMGRHFSPMFTEAADEIERLRAELSKWQAWGEAETAHYPTGDERR